MFLLTLGPHLYYVDPGTMTFKGEIPWSKDLRIEPKNFKTFFIHTVSLWFFFRVLSTVLSFAAQSQILLGRPRWLCVGMVQSGGSSEAALFSRRGSGWGFQQTSVVKFLYSKWCVLVALFLVKYCFLTSSVCLFIQGWTHIANGILFLGIC